MSHSTSSNSSTIDFESLCLSRLEKAVSSISEVRIDVDESVATNNEDGKLN